LYKEVRQMAAHRRHWC